MHRCGYVYSIGTCEENKQRTFRGSRFCEIVTHLSENPDILFLTGIKGTLLGIMWEEGRRV